MRGDFRYDTSSGKDCNRSSFLTVDVLPTNEPFWSEINQNHTQTAASNDSKETGAKRTNWKPPVARLQSWIYPMAICCPQSKTQEDVKCHPQSLHCLLPSCAVVPLALSFWYRSIMEVGGSIDASCGSVSTCIQLINNCFLSIIMSKLIPLQNVLPQLLFLNCFVATWFRLCLS